MIKVTGETTLSNSFMGNTVQICVVTADMFKRLEGFVRLGVGPWRVYTFSPDNVREQTYRGKPEPYSMLLAVAWSGTSFWEVIQPLNGNSIYKDWLREHGEGIHHVAQECAPLKFEQQIAEFESRGLSVVQTGVWRDLVRYAYIGTEDLTGMTIELFTFAEGFTFPEPEVWYPGPPPRS
jgi:methylmalonyl-CoA/ethylmalonyl-CoA epimerase